MCFCNCYGCAPILTSGPGESSSQMHEPNPASLYQSLQGESGLEESQTKLLYSIRVVPGFFVMCLNAPPKEQAKDTSCLIIVALALTLFCTPVRLENFCEDSV